MIAWWFALLARAQDPAAEHERLGEELVKLAQRNTWAGVDRTYRALVALGAAPSPREHLLGAQAAQAEGQTLLALWRLQRIGPQAGSADPIERDAIETAAAERVTILGRYGLVSIYVGAGGVPALFRDDMPFSQQEQDAIAAARSRLGTTRAFRGLLPVGTYRVDAETFTVEPGADWVTVVVGTR
jgi:hypothetical protein